ncbi:MAG: DNA repair exonuclease [Planctomycetota bacterium]
MPKFIHAADLHLDSPLRGLSKYEGAPEDELRLATREALKNLVRLAEEERVDFVLIAGDVYDGDWKDYNTGLFFAAQMSRLRALGIPVVMISGNHDAESQITRSLTLPDNVTRLSHKKPETKIFEKLGVAIHGQSFETRAVTDDLSAHYPRGYSDAFNIGLLHTLAEGQEGHDRYAPCTIDGLCKKGYEYWALGHVHTRAVLHDAEPFILFPGNIQGRHARETEGKGCTVVTFDNGKILNTQHRDLHVVRWTVLRIDATNAATSDDVAALAKTALRDVATNFGDKLIAARVEIFGSTRAHSELMTEPEQIINDIRSSATDTGNGQIWVEKVKLLTTPHRDLAALLNDDTPLSNMLRSITQGDSAEVLSADLRAELAQLHEKLPSELTSGPDPMDWDDPAQRDKLVTDARSLLIPRLQSAWNGGV